MTTLYDLLGALPQDDAQSLRTAFRNAVKGAHPDIRPGDPDAALKFRQIVNASEILSDDEQRAVYDHLLELARREQKSAAKTATANRVQRLVSGLIGFAGISAATAGGYLLFMHMSVASVDAAHNFYGVMRALPEIASVHLAGLPSMAGSTSPVGGESTKIPVETSAAGATGPESHAEIIPEVKADQAPDPTASEARSLLARKLTAYKNGGLNGTIAEFDRAEQPKPDFSPAYVDRGAIFYRERKLERAFADIGGTKRIETTSHSKSPPAAARKSRFHHTAIAVPLRRLFARRTAAQVRPRQEGYASLGGP